ncbi:MAG: DUF998 domain-containing protein [Hyphomicrobiales bacterium]
MATPATSARGGIRPVHHGPRVLPATRIEWLVLAGTAMFVLYVFMDVVASLAYDGYSYRDQTISELSAFGAPTRPFWLVMTVFYNLMTFAFAFGVLWFAGGRRTIRAVGWLLLALAFVGILWWFAPMHRREVLEAGGGTWQDTMHLVVGGLNALYFAVIAVGAFAFGRAFRLYPFATIAAMLVFGTLMGIQAPAVSDNDPTPWLGIWERITVEGAMLWQGVFAVLLFARLRGGGPTDR